MSHYECSAAEEDAMDAGVTEQMHDRARDELLAEIAEPGELRSEWISFCEECPPVTVEQYVKDMEKLGLPRWEQAVAEQWEMLMEAT